MLFNGCFSSVTKESIKSLFLFVDTSLVVLLFRFTYIYSALFLISLNANKHFV